MIISYEVECFVIKTEIYKKSQTTKLVTFWNKKNKKKKIINYYKKRKKERKKNNAKGNQRGRKKHTIISLN